QDFCRRHERYLVAAFDGDDCGLESNDSFSGANIALQETAHGMRLLHVVGNLFQNPLLRWRGMEWQNFLDGLAHAVVELEGDSGLRFLLAALEFQAQFGEE